MVSTPELALDERPLADYRAIYICGVARDGYHRKPKTNYPHNLHAVIIPRPGAHGSLSFEQWQLEVTDGVFDAIPNLDDLPAEYRGLANEFTTCRIFRWAVCNQHRFA